MKKINSENLWEFVNNLATNQKVKFKVFYDDNYITEILWNGYYFEWEEGTFTSEGFFNPLYDFIVIEDNDKLENNFNYIYQSEDEKVNANFENIKTTIKDIVNHINKIEERLDER